MKPLCIYHGGCIDGWAAAWIVYRVHHGEVELFPGTYQSPPPDVLGRDLFIVDFSYKRPVMIDLINRAAKVCVLDHHKTAQAELEGLDGIRPFVDVKFDMARSGAGLAWDYFFHGVKRPRLINHIEDRDLGGGIAFPSKLEWTREIYAAVASYPFSIETWNEIVELADTNPDALIREGQAIDRKHFKDIEDLLDLTMRTMMIGNHIVPVANLPHTMTSDAGHKMAEGNPFAATYQDTPEGRVFSLRSSEDGLDVSEIAKAYGGGGHKHAAGFKVPIGWEGEAIDAAIST